MVGLDSSHALAALCSLGFSQFWHYLKQANCVNLSTLISSLKTLEFRRRHCLLYSRFHQEPSGHQSSSMWDCTTIGPSPPMSYSPLEPRSNILHRDAIPFARGPLQCRWPRRPKSAHTSTLLIYYLVSSFYLLCASPCVAPPPSFACHLASHILLSQFPPFSFSLSLRDAVVGLLLRCWSTSRRRSEHSLITPLVSLCYSCYLCTGAHLCLLRAPSIARFTAPELFTVANVTATAVSSPDSSSHHHPKSHIDLGFPFCSSAGPPL